MNFTKTLIAVAATVASVGAFAIPTATVGVSGTTPLYLTSNSLINPPLIANTGGAAHIGSSTGTVVATISGGSVLSGDYSYSDTQAFGAPIGGTYLSVGPTSGSPSTMLSLTGGTNFVSFLWGSPDTYNELRVFTNASLTNYTSFFAGTGSLASLSTTGDQSASAAKYVAFTTLGNEKITSLQFLSSSNAFEAANFAVTAPVPEPETYALMLGGLGVLGFVARRRRSV